MQSFRDLRISLKLLLGFGVVLAILGFVSFFNVLSSADIQRKSMYVKERHYADTIVIIEMASQAGYVFSDVHHATEAADYEPFRQAQKEREHLIADLNRLKSELAHVPNLVQMLKNFEDTFEQAFSRGERMVRYSVEQDLVSFIEARRAFLESHAAFTAAAETLKQAIAEALAETLDEINRLSSKSIRLSSALAIFGFVVGILIALATSRQIANPMNRVVQMTQELGEGRLYNQLGIHRGDEIGKVSVAMDEMAGNLAAMVRRLGRAAEELTVIAGNISKASGRVHEGGKVQAHGVEVTSTAVLQISASVKEVGQGVEKLTVSSSESTTSVLEMSSSIEEVAANAEKLAQAVEEVSSSITEMASTIEQVAEGVTVLKESSDTTASSVAEMDVSIKQVEQNAKDTAGIAESVRKDAEFGKTSVEATIRGIHEIRSASQTASEAIKSLSEKAQNIGSVISVIDEVADQTNLLALNAAIIAAQAGEHGRGFAVVADEIRELAELTSSSTREIAAAIQAVQEETRRAVQAISQADQSIGEGEKLSLRSGEALGKIVQGTQKAAERMEQIAGSTVEQAKGSQMIRNAVERVSQMVDQIAVAIREQNKGTSMIMSAAHRMKDLTVQVSSSSREQSGASKVIARSMEDISDMVRKINNACLEQNRGGEQIVRATEDIRSSSE